MTRLVLTILVLSTFIVAGILYAPHSKDKADNGLKTDTIVDKPHQPNTRITHLLINR